MVLSFHIHDQLYQVNTGEAIDISIPLNFNGPQPNAFGVEAAISKPCKAEDLVGDTRLGGSCNFEQYTFIPHCNGTHTECVGHITHERISVRDCLLDVIMAAVLISVEPGSKNFSLSNPDLNENDKVITRGVIESALRTTNLSLSNIKALIIRTLPNDESKLTRQYLNNIPPFFSKEAMEYIVEFGFKHLLVDLPSIDRLFDEGKLANHRIFWNVEPDSFETNGNTRINSTITELIYVPNEVEDGEYLLNLQIAPFATDASPGRPILFKIIEPPRR